MVKYVLDEVGQKSDVIIPINIWEQLQLVDRKRPIKKMDKQKLLKYAGKISLSIDPLVYQQDLDATLVSFDKGFRKVKDIVLLTPEQ